MKDYYYVACNDLKFLEDIKRTTHYNNIAIMCQQVGEKLLKSVCELSCPDEVYKKTRSLSKLYGLVSGYVEGRTLSNRDLAYLTDFYFDARYPGDDYIDVSETETSDCLSILQSIVERVREFRESKGLSTEGLKSSKRQDLCEIAEGLCEK